MTGFRPRHLILVGLPGAGKSTVGALLAERLGRPFVDLDREIERRTGRSIPDLFAHDGEEHFRELERELTAELAVGPASVVAPGGGWITRPDTVALLSPPGRIIHLRVSPERALHRLRRDPVLRPLLVGVDPLLALRRLAEDRRDAYARADLAVDTDAVEPQGVADEVAVLVGPLLDA